MYLNSRVSVHVFGFTCSKSRVQIDKLEPPCRFSHVMWRCYVLAAIDTLVPSNYPIRRPSTNVDGNNDGRREGHDMSDVLSSSCDLR